MHRRKETEIIILQNKQIKTFSTHLASRTCALIASQDLQTVPLMPRIAITLKTNNTISKIISCIFFHFVSMLVEVLKEINSIYSRIICRLPFHSRYFLMTFIVYHKYLCFYLILSLLIFIPLIRQFQSISKCKLRANGICFNCHALHLTNAMQTECNQH